MFTGRALGLMRHLPLSAKVANTEQLAFLAESESGKIVKGIHFVGGRSFLAEAGGTQFLFEGFAIRDLELDFNFVRHDFEYSCGI